MLAPIASFSAYDSFLTATLADWPPGRVVGLAAAVAERWLPAYRAFAAAEDWGDPAALRRALDAVWAHARGTPLTPADADRHLGLLDDATPHLDDFDADDALVACCVLADALRACRGPAAALPFTHRALTGVFEGLVHDWPADPAGEARVWKKPAVRGEVQAQLELVEAAAALDPDALKAKAAALAVKPKPAPKPTAPPGVTNRVMFDQYRRMVESDLRTRHRGGPAAPGEYFVALAYLGYWMARYSRRMQALNGAYGRLADEPGRRAVLARNRALDAADPGPAAWGAAAAEAVAMCLRNNRMMNTLDVAAADEPHPSGPSLRRLFREGGWERVLAWADHRPAAWAAEDARKKKGKAHADAALGDHLARAVEWAATGDPLHPWAATADGAAWRVRVNDFPDEPLYTLLIGADPAGDFHDWPEGWRRPAGV